MYIVTELLGLKKAVNQTKASIKVCPTARLKAVKLKKFIVFGFMPEPPSIHPFVAGQAE